MAALGLFVLALLVSAALSPPIVSNLRAGGLGPLGATVSSLASLIAAGFAVTVLVLSVVGGHPVKTSVVWYAILLGTLLLGVAAVEVLWPIAWKSGTYDYLLFDGSRFVSTPLRVSRNRQGWRSDLDYEPLQRNPDNVLLIGDSFVVGVVDQDQTIDAILMKRFFADGSRHVLNVSRSGASIVDYLRFAQRFRDYAAGWVLLGLYVDNDFAGYPRLEWAAGIKEALAASRTLSLLAALRRPDPRQALAFLDPATLALIPFEEKNVDPLFFVDLYRRERGHYESFRRNLAEDPTYERTLLAIRALFPAADFCLLVFPSKYQIVDAYLPHLRRFGYRMTEPVDGGLQEDLNAWARSEDVCALDLLPTFRARERGGERLYYLVDDHLNAAGNGVVAREIYALVTGGPR